MITENKLKFFVFNSSPSFIDIDIVGLVQRSANVEAMSKKAARQFVQRQITIHDIVFGFWDTPDGKAAQVGIIKGSSLLRSGTQKDKSVAALRCKSATWAATYTRWFGELAPPSGLYEAVGYYDFASGEKLGWTIPYLWKGKKGEEQDEVMED
jgi:hypothetical protein